MLLWRLMNYELKPSEMLSRVLDTKKMADDYNNNVIININDNATADSLSEEEWSTLTTPIYPHFGYSSFLNIL